MSWGSGPRGRLRTFLFRQLSVVVLLPLSSEIEEGLAGALASSWVLEERNVLLLSPLFSFEERVAFMILECDHDDPFPMSITDVDLLRQRYFVHPCIANTPILLCHTYLSARAKRKIQRNVDHAAHQFSVGCGFGDAESPVTHLTYTTV